MDEWLCESMEMMTREMDSQNLTKKYKEKKQKNGHKWLQKRKKLYVQEMHKIFCLYRKQCHIKKNKMI